MSANILQNNENGFVLITLTMLGYNTSTHLKLRNSQPNAAKYMKFNKIKTNICFFKFRTFKAISWPRKVLC